MTQLPQLVEVAFAPQPGPVPAWKRRYTYIWGLPTPPTVGLRALVRSHDGPPTPVAVVGLVDRPPKGYSLADLTPVLSLEAGQENPGRA